MTTPSGPRPIRLLSIAGRIGVGKTTLVRGALADPAVIGSLEVINGDMLDDYIKGRLPGLAFAFQCTALHGATVRLRLGLETEAKTGQPIVIERDLFENLIFAVANASAGKIGAEEMAAYWRYVRYELGTLRKALPANRAFWPHHVCLWAPEGMTIQRMIERGTASELTYLDDYLEHLAHAYFRAILESQLLTDDPDWDLRRPYQVVDWTAYGSWRTSPLRALLMEGRPLPAAAAVPAPLNGSGVSYAPEDERGALENAGMPLFFLEDTEEEAARRPHPMWTRAWPGSTIGLNHHFDLAWYESLDVGEHKKARSAFRDQFCRAMLHDESGGKGIVLHWRRAVPTSAPGHRHVYVKLPRL